MNDPIAVWKDNEIIEGHGRYIALRKMGHTEVPVIRLDGLTDAQRREYMLVHNQTTSEKTFTEKEMRNIRDYIPQVLNYWIAQDFIKGYELIKAGNKIRGVTIKI